MTESVLVYFKRIFIERWRKKLHIYCMVNKCKFLWIIPRSILFNPLRETFRNSLGKPSIINFPTEHDKNVSWNNLLKPYVSRMYYLLSYFWLFISHLHHTCIYMFSIYVYGVVHYLFCYTVLNSNEYTKIHLFT
jgi:hypothetical protein